MATSRPELHEGNAAEPSFNPENEKHQPATATVAAETDTTDDIDGLDKAQAGVQIAIALKRAWSKPTLAIAFS
ncbi:hypothetical protein J8I82_38055, partial [Cupriavidus sp. LEh25]